MPDADPTDAGNPSAPEAGASVKPVAMTPEQLAEKFMDGCFNSCDQEHHDFCVKKLAGLIRQHADALAAGLGKALRLCHSCKGERVRYYGLTEKPETCRSCSPLYELLAEART